MRKSNHFEVTETIPIALARHEILLNAQLLQADGDGDITRGIQPWKSAATMVAIAPPMNGLLYFVRASKPPIGPVIGPMTYEPEAAPSRPRNTI